MPFGDDFNSALARNLGAEPHPQSHSLADAFAERLGHAFGGGTRGEAARFQNKDAAIFRPGFACKHKRNARGLARTGRRYQDGGVAMAQRLRQVGKRGVDW